MTITSPSFANGTDIPARFTCDGADVNPALRFGDIPAGTISLALIVDDPDSPSGEFAHWLVWNIPPALTEIPEAVTKADWPAGVVEGTNDFPQTGWGGPCPGKGRHRYRFTLYALNTLLELPPTTTKPELLATLSDKIISQSKLSGLYQRPQ
ncbi:MAG: YbhB/YbcL family Raf kinase inhibitor-like protein [bacterium]|nr:YbhB/YbcL family Raf kinase inhibitor-like protein [bacterium]